jgi:hypothetical protein
LWNEESDRDTVYQFVRESIEKHGYTVSLGISTVKEELKAIDNDVREWTTGDVSVPHDVPVSYGEYYKIKEFSGLFYIRKKDVSTADEINYKKVTFQHDYNNTYNSQPHFIKKSPKENKIYISDNGNDANTKEYAIECKPKNRMESRPYIKAAHSKLVEHWFEKIEKVLGRTEKLKSEIENYKGRYLKHIYTNLFVDKEFALYVEKNLNDLKSEIEKDCELEAERIKSAIKKCCGDPATPSDAASASVSLDING